ncbi:hypothetical protein TWF970_005013 [Orbilia oligospora]|uniref:Uncharacterized protein n=1 Tax=Orbilia oligospora TaxID=2813651 RepID=A0A7C8V9W6_ORBOL|nr:hypothetical protein TWF970_005013 [Orbilia oligospora]
MVMGLDFWGLKLERRMLRGMGDDHDGTDADTDADTEDELKDERRKTKDERWMRGSGDGGGGGGGGGGGEERMKEKIS